MPTPLAFLFILGIFGGRLASKLLAKPAAVVVEIVLEVEAKLLVLPTRFIAASAGTVSQADVLFPPSCSSHTFSIPSTIVSADDVDALDASESLLEPTSVLPSLSYPLEKLILLQPAPRHLRHFESSESTPISILS
jgi:hypothetical protein